MLIDSHVHFDDFVVDGSFDDVMERAQHAGVEKMIAIGGSSESNRLTLRLAEKHPERISAAVGYDRYEADKSPDRDELRVLLADPAVKAVGEIGLDYYYTPETADLQKKLFAENLALAVEFQKPVVVHSRDADEDTLAMLREFSNAWKGDSARVGVLHCFTRALSVARRVLDLGLYISFSGILTFRNADRLREVVAYVPNDRLLIETDSPYLAPVPKRGKRNEPAYVVHVANELAEQKVCSLKYIAELTARNARRLFSLE